MTYNENLYIIKRCLNFFQTYALLAQWESTMAKHQTRSCRQLFISDLKTRRSRDFGIMTSAWGNLFIGAKDNGTNWVENFVLFLYTFNWLLTMPTICRIGTTYSINQQTPVIHLDTFTQVIQFCYGSWGTRYHTFICLRVPLRFDSCRNVLWIQMDRSVSVCFKMNSITMCLSRRECRSFIIFYQRLLVKFILWINMPTLTSEIVRQNACIEHVPGINKLSDAKQAWNMLVLQSNCHSNLRQKRKPV